MVFLLRLGRVAQLGSRLTARKMTGKADKIIYTLTDEAPALATYSLLPILQRFIAPAGIKVETSDISVASRILAQFADKLPPGQKEPDNLAALGELCKRPEALIIKLPNVSASIPQLNEAIAELQSQGYKIPNYPQMPKNAEEEEIKSRYAKASSNHLALTRTRIPIIFPNDQAHPYQLLSLHKTLKSYFCAAHACVAQASYCFDSRALKFYTFLSRFWAALSTLSSARETQTAAWRLLLRSTRKRIRTSLEPGARIQRPTSHT
jgi:hypothetical protein